LHQLFHVRAAVAELITAGQPRVKERVPAKSLEQRLGALCDERVDRDIDRTGRAGVTARRLSSEVSPTLTKLFRHE
jgi:hypothetical protein